MRACFYPSHLKEDKIWWIHDPRPSSTSLLSCTELGGKWKGAMSQFEVGRHPYLHKGICPLCHSLHLDVWKWKGDPTNWDAKRNQRQGEYHRWRQGGGGIWMQLLLEGAPRNKCLPRLLTHINIYVDKWNMSLFTAYTKQRQLHCEAPTRTNTTGEFKQPPVI